MTNPILSLCIPTYNRACYLKETLTSIVSQSRFLETNDVEIVILDNGSTDNTYIIIDDFEKKFSSKIRRFQNASNDIYLDLEKLFSWASGEFIKFNNDTLKHNEGSLDKMIAILYECKNFGAIPFFATGVINLKKIVLCDNLNSFIGIVSFWSTWGGLLGCGRRIFRILKILIDINAYKYFRPMFYSDY
jgi:glycosyltransferase involved in cell wall biosynthesis